MAYFLSRHTVAKINIFDNNRLLLDQSLLRFLDALLVFLNNRIRLLNIILPLCFFDPLKSIPEHSVFSDGILIFLFALEIWMNLLFWLMLAVVLFGSVVVSAALMVTG